MQNQLSDEEREIQYVFEQIINKNYTILPETIAIGTVLKITLEGDLDKNGYEKGYLVLTPNSGILEHQHINDIEKYTKLTGTMSVKNKTTSENICLIGEKHNIDKVKELTIIKTLKINKKIKKQKQYKYKKR